MSRRARFVQTVFIALILAGCRARKTDAQGVQCTFNGECDGTNVCVANYCRTQCATDRDCVRGRCVPRPGIAGMSVCLLDDSPRECERDSQCGTGQICTPGGVCRAECQKHYDCQLKNPALMCVSMNDGGGVCRLPDAGTGIDTLTAADVPDATVDVNVQDIVDAENFTPDATDAEDIAVTDTVDPDAGDDVVATDAVTTDVPLPPLASSVVGLYETDGAEITLGTGTDVVSWAPRVGAGPVLTAVGSATQFVPSSVLSGQVLRFTGGALRSTTASWNTVQNTIIVLVVPTTLSGADDIIGTGSIWTPNDTLLMVYGGRIAGHFWPTTSGSGTQDYGTISVPVNQPVVLTQVCDGLARTLDLYTNGVRNPATSATWTQVAGTVLRPLWIGIRGIGATGADAFVGEIASVLIYDRALSDQERIDAETFVRVSHGLP